MIADIHDWYGEYIPERHALVYCRNLSVASALQAFLKPGSVTTYPSMPLTPDSKFDIGIVTFEPLTNGERAYFHGTFNAHLKPDAEILYTIA